MTDYFLSQEADADINEIAQHSLEQRGVARAERYILELHEFFRRVAAFPELGQNESRIRSDYMRMRSGSHSIFYRKIDDGVLILRVLHQRMDVDRHL